MRNGCNHDLSRDSTLVTRQVKMPNEEDERFFCKCMSCGKETAVAKTAWQAKSEAVAGCWEAVW